MLITTFAKISFTTSMDVEPKETPKDIYPNYRKENLKSNIIVQINMV